MGIDGLTQRLRPAFQMSNHPTLSVDPYATVAKNLRNGMEKSAITVANCGFWYHVIMHISLFHHQLNGAFVIMERCVVERWMVDVQYPVEHPFVSAMLENRWLVVGFLVIMSPSEDESQNNDSCQYYNNIR